MAKKNRLTITKHDGYTIISLDNIEIWDGADLALLRETLTQLIERQNCQTVGVDMQYVKYIPSGFFGMLFDWHERGASIRLYASQPHVRNMLWFRQFFDPVGEGCHRLLSEPKQPCIADVPPSWMGEPEMEDIAALDSHRADDWDHEQDADSVAASLRK
jgi:hypothetical protein